MALLLAFCLTTFFATRSAVFAASIIANYGNDQFQHFEQYAGMDNWVIQKLGTGINGTIGSLTLYLQGSGMMGKFYDFYIYCFNDSGYTSSCGSYGEQISGGIQTNSTAAFYTINTQYTAGEDGHAIGYAFDPSKYYELYVAGAGNWPSSYMNWYGSVVASFPQATFASGSTGTLGNLYFVLDTTGSPSPPDTSSRIDTFTFSTTTNYANITGFWNATTTSGISEKLLFWQDSALFGKESWVEVVATTTGAFNFSFPFAGNSYTPLGATTTAEITTAFTLTAELEQVDLNHMDWSTLEEMNQFLTILDKHILEVDVATDYGTTTRELAAYPEYECGLTSIIGCIKNALIWTFYPTAQSLNNWNSFIATIQSKAPVGYFFNVKNSLGGLSATSTPAFSLTIPSHLKTYIFDPFDIGISGILWLFFILHFYKRLKHITI